MNDEQPEIELPRGVALAWGVAVNPQRGPKRELSIERIVEAAVEIADAEGLAAVSMSSVAASLGFTTMSLYRYVTAKDDLILLMQEYGTGLPPASIAEAADWRTALTLWARESLANWAAHPWLVDIPISGTPMTPNNLAWMEVALVALRDTPLDMLERIGALLLISGQTRFEASVERGYTDSNRELGMSATERDRAEAHILSTLVTAEAFPELRNAIASGWFETGANPFEFGLSRILDGIERHMETLAAGRTPSPPEPVETLQSHPRDPAVRLARQARREAETKLREAQKREREAIARAREREKHEAERAKQQAEKDRQRAEKR